MFDSIQDLEDYIEAEFIHFGISDWEFKWNKLSTVTLGQTFLFENRIELSLKFVIANFHDPKTIRNVILHEIAHALAFKHERHTEHGEPWKRFCNITGAKPEQYQVIKTSAKRSKLVIQDDTYSLAY